jgi:trehalose synthase
MAGSGMVQLSGEPRLLLDVPVPPLPLERFELVQRPDRFRAFMKAFSRARDVFAGRVVWNVNSTARGGGVAEMLRSLLAYERGAGVDARWMVIGGSPRFFEVTKRIHNHLHGFPGDGGALGPEEHETYREVAEANADELTDLVRPGDVVILHDPQTAGLCSAMKEAGAVVVWRCHVGRDTPNELARGAWDFLQPYVLPADAYVFSRQAFAWEGLEPHKVAVVPPVIDAFSPKNQALGRDQVGAILATAGLIDAEPESAPSYMREGGTPSVVVRRAVYSEGGRPPPPGARLVVQVSRWDRLKDPVGVIHGFAHHVAPRTEAHLIVAGPAVEAVSDDPEGAQVLEESIRTWEGLPRDVQGLVHLACLPMDDTEENAAMVNALQSAADVVVQKSLAEGFGLTVAEAMWKARPVVASRIGGIQDQVVHRKTGLLVDDPTDLARYGEAVRSLLRHPRRAALMGERARIRVRDQYLGPRHLVQFLELLGRLLDH